MTELELIALAKEARTHAYVPYSGYAVGAALRGGELLDVLREERGIEQTLVDQALDEGQGLPGLQH